MTPLREAGERLDEDAIAPLLDFYAAGGLDGLLMLGTAGEGILLAAGALRIVVHCGALPRPRVRAPRAIAPIAISVAAVAHGRLSKGSDPAVRDRPHTLPGRSRERDLLPLRERQIPALEITTTTRTNATLRDHPPRAF